MGTLLQRKDRFARGEKQTITRAMREKLDLGIALALIGFKDQRKLAIALCDLRSLSRGCGYCGGFGGGGGSALERMSVVEANKKGEEFVSS